MKDLNIVHIITSMNTGGAERMLSKLLNYNTNNNQIVILLMGGEIKYSLPDNIQVISLNFKKSVSDMREVKKLFGLLDDLNPNIIQTWMNHSNVLGLLYKKYKNKHANLIWNIRHSLRENPSKYSTTNILFKILKRNISYSDGIIFVSNESMEKHFANGFYHKNSIVIQNGFKIESVNRYKKTPVHSDETFVMGHVGRYIPFKNQKIILKAFNKLSQKGYNIVLYLIGRGMEKDNQELLGYINEKYMDNVHLMGEQREINKFYQQMDVFILSSYNLEGFPNVIGESMINSTPVITTDAGDSYEIVKDTGFKMETYESEELVNIMEEILANPEVLNSLGNYARERIIKYYNIDNKAEEYFKYYYRVNNK